jgi:hypothetical protein
MLQGFDTDHDFKSAQRLLTRLLVVEIGGLEIAIEAAKNYRVLRRRGVTIRKTIDTLIATRCIESGYELLHSDRDFDPFAAYLGLNCYLMTIQKLQDTTRLPGTNPAQRPSGRRSARYGSVLPQMW